MIVTRPFLGDCLQLRPWNRELFHHFHIAHNTPQSLIPQILRNHCFQFLLGIGINKVYYEQCKNCEYQTQA